MALLGLMAALTFLVIQTLLLIQLCCMFGVRSIYLVIQTWMELLNVSIHVHLNIFLSLIIWTVALICLPVRVLTALHRERLMEMRLHEMQAELKSLMWDRKALEDRLQIVIKEYRMMQLMLEEVEEEHDFTIVKIELLEGELQDLKDENYHLKDVQIKTLWSFKGEGERVCDRDVQYADKYALPYGIPWESKDNGNVVTQKDILLSKDALEDQSKCKTKMHNFAATGSDAVRYIQPCIGGYLSKTLDIDKMLEEQKREVALYQSLFSAILSLVVGITIWEAETPCVPLVLALFTVVGMSLKSVDEFFTTIKNKSASDAVALLSFNWFLLGALICPALPQAAHVFVHVALSSLQKTCGWFRFPL